VSDEVAIAQPLAPPRHMRRPVRVVEPQAAAPERAERRPARGEGKAPKAPAARKRTSGTRKGSK